MKYAIAALTAVLSGSTAAAADLPVYSEPQAVISTAPFDWTGLYLGGSVGGGVGSSDAEATIEGKKSDTHIAAGDWASSGAVLGGHVGYQYQFGAVVLGAELAAQFSTISGDGTVTVDSGPFSAEGSLETDLDWLAMARLRAGFALDRALVYTTGGLAFGGVENTVSYQFGPSSDEWSGDDTATGWTIGVGMDYAITDNIIAGIEVNYIDLGENTVDVEGTDVHFDNAFATAVAKVSYRF